MQILYFCLDEVFRESRQTMGTYLQLVPRACKEGRSCSPLGREHRSCPAVWRGTKSLVLMQSGHSAPRVWLLWPCKRAVGLGPPDAPQVSHQVVLSFLSPRVEQCDFLRVDRL